MAVQCERIGHENLQLQTECQKTLSRTQEIDMLKRKIVDSNSQILQIDEEASNVKNRLSNQERLFNEVSLRMDF